MRVGELADLNELLALEAMFPGDRLSARQLRRHLRSASAWLGVIVVAGVLSGYALLFFRRGLASARLYSLAVAPQARGLGLGRRLLQAAETEAGKRGCSALRLEVRADNQPANALYQAQGYQRQRALPGYYEDGGDGWRYCKRLEDRHSSG